MVFIVVKYVICVDGRLKLLLICVFKDMYCFFMNEFLLLIFYFIFIRVLQNWVLLLILMFLENIGFLDMIGGLLFMMNLFDDVLLNNF